MSLQEIIDALEKADGPSRELDAEIDAALRIGVRTLPSWAWDNFPIWRAKQKGACEVLHDNGKGGLWWPSQPFTASVDTAIALCQRVKPGWYWRGGHVPVGHYTRGRCWNGWAIVSRTDASNCDRCDEAVGWAETVPLAICLATLRAKLEEPTA